MLGLRDLNEDVVIFPKIIIMNVWMKKIGFLQDLSYILYYIKFLSVVNIDITIKLIL